LPDHIYEFPIDKLKISNAIIENNSNLKKIIKIVHKEIRNQLRDFLKKNKNKKFVILDIPLLLENKMNKKKDILVYVESRKTDILRNLKKRKNFNRKILNKFKKIQLPLVYKKKISKFIIKNKFTKKSVKDAVENILKVIENERSSS
jgi:dephospho-CoA kinase